MTQQVHLFVDNSNVIGGAQRAALEREGAPWMAVRVYWRNFFQLIEGSMLPATRLLAGSLPPGNEELWEYSRKYGYDTTLLRRVQRDDGRLAEQAVDEVLHARIAGVLLDYHPPPEQVLVLATGDGNLSEFGTSFLQQVQRAVRIGWTVKIVSWKAQLSNKFARLRAAHPSQIEVIHLDDFYNAVTFIKGGEYMVEGRNVRVAPRIVSNL
jgi:hypothetical protein